jgi:predicted PurR-regulated permease PerM
MVIAMDRRTARVAADYILPVVAVLLGIWLARDLWPPFQQVTVLFFLGWLVAFMLDPAVSWLVARFPRLSRGPAAALVFLVIAGLALFVGVGVALSFTDSAREVIARGPAIQDELSRSMAAIESVSRTLGYPLDTHVLVGEIVDSVRSQLGCILEGVIGGGLSVVGNGLTIVFIGMVMVVGKTDAIRFTRHLVPPDRVPLLDTARAAVARSFGGFIRGQFGLAAVYGLLVAGIAIVFGVPFVPFIGVTTLLLQSVPWFGQMVSWIPLVAVTFAFAPDALGPVLVSILVGWFIVQNVVSPRVLGSAVGLDPLVVLAAVLVGGAVAGPLGAIFGVPVAAAIASVIAVWLDVARPAGRVPPASTRRDISALG